MNVASAPVSSFPQTMTIDLHLEIEVEDQEDKEYFFSSDNNVNPGFIADVFDSFLGVKKVNNQTKDQIQQILTSEL